MPGTPGVPGFAGAPPPGRPAAPLPQRRELGTDRHPEPLGFARLARLVIGLLALSCGLLGGMTAYAAFTLPGVDGAVTSDGTIRIVDRHGELLAQFGSGSGTPHTSVTLDRVAPVLQHAIVAIEDRSFYTEGAFNPGRVFRALLIDVVAGRGQQGASTITQQLAKRAFLLDDLSGLRKLREALLANQIDQRYSKDRILEMYLNIVYFGHGATGIEDAATTYFGRHAADLTLAEASLLAGLPQAPSQYDPFQNPAAAWARQHDVLQALVANGTITQPQADAIDPLLGGSRATTAQVQAREGIQAAALSDLQHGHPPVRPGTLAPHFVDYVRNQLPQVLGRDATNWNGTLTVTTTLDLSAQRQAEAAVSSGVASLAPRGADNAALLMLDSHAGDILAMVGSAGYDNAAIGGQFNLVTGARRPGSAFKPIVYAQAFGTGAVSPSTLLDDTRQESAALGGVQDFDGRFMGRISAARALVLSRNVPAEQLMVRSGIQPVIELARQLGITTDLAPYPSTAIGASSVRMVELAQAYGAFSNGGQAVTARAILHVEDSSGHVLFDGTTPSPGATVLTGDQANAVNGVLQGYPRQWGLPFHRPTAGKSGTTDNFVDAWYMAYTDSWVVATWAGHTDGAAAREVGMNGVFGTDVAKAIAVPFVNSLPPSP